MSPVTRYAKSGDVHVAYQTYGAGPLDLVVVPPFVWHIDGHWEQPDCARWLARFGRFARVALFDKRGTGMSDRVSDVPDLEQRMDDVRAVMDAAGMSHAALVGLSEGAPLAALFAARHPDRCRALVLYGPPAHSPSAASDPSAVRRFIDYIDAKWGSGDSVYLFAPSRAADPAFKSWWGRVERLGASPSAAIALMHMNARIDITDALPRIGVPTLLVHRSGDRVASVASARAFADAIPGARFVELSGDDHLPFVGDNTERIGDLVEEFLTGAVTHAPIERVLATVLFMDIVDSTARAAELGDKRWRDLLDAFYTAMRRELPRHRGREIDTAGDGVFASFDSPARAIECARALSDAVRRLGVQTRIGVHTGECEVIGEKIGGIAVHIGARVAAEAMPGEVLVSRTVKDLVVGSGIAFEDRGVRTLKGVPGEWPLYAVR